MTEELNKPGEKQWTLEISNVAKDKTNWETHCIYKVPDFMADLHKGAFTPLLMSFGPFHHGNSRYRGMEIHKARALHRFLDRRQKPREYFENALRKVEHKLWACYDWPPDFACLDQAKFLEIMLLDGCFLLEFLREDEENDPIFGKKKAEYVYQVFNDMLLLENQIPQLVLETLLEQSPRGLYDAIKGLERLYHMDKAQGKIMLEGFKEMGALHWLDKERQTKWEGIKGPEGLKEKPRFFKRMCEWIKRLCGVPLVQEEQSKENERETQSFIKRLTTTNLDEAGVNLKKSRTRAFKDVSFSHGVLRMPALIVDDHTGSELLNCMAFEQLQVGIETKVCSYVAFMEQLIDTIKDVELLEKAGIIENYLGSQEKLAEVFNGICDGITVEDDFLRGVRIQVKRHCDRRWNKWRAYFVHTYFRNPWTVIAFIVGLLITALTTLSTVVSLLRYFAISHP
ncbi:UPF0481 protein At3g47200 [Amborella trichopoda]|uniref:Uncharacterized protein n=1 Tax=Amborella trichopoda TaxID=13333 RepID=W1PP64_AMBTC|nr:UPF0481 protein At3g47200 [Amborella trichopoda]ERN09848.1 hypothetical protein AMTR_s00013p00068760 [Amborella trichopoda]|eukprot:XP_006848267.1 UPF0481 protein At3g47200 [Amborella trichopoda]